MNIKHTLKYAEEPSLDELMVVKKANDWIVGSRAQPVPKMLFGEFWLEGELAVLAAESGAGKSLLAVQIAESIARGRPSEPLDMTAAPQKVLYLDLKLSEKQFEMRYAEEYDAERGEFLRKHHKFPANFIRVEIDLHGKLPEGFRSFDEVLPRLVEKLIHKYKARVVIIDNITYLQRSIYGYRETYTVMKELDSLKRQRGISILVLARSARYGASQHTGIGSSSALYSRFADSVFTIGQSKLDAAVRYIKHITAHSTDKIYDSSHVPSFRITRLNGNFLGFEHEAFAPESVHLQSVHDQRDWPLIQKIKEMADADDKMSIRDIAAELDMPKTTVHRYLQMWRPPVHTAGADGVVLSDDQEQEPHHSQFYFPGKEEYDEADRDPRLHNLGEGPESALLGREGYLIQMTRGKARREYERTGTAPTLAEMKQRMPEWRELLAAQAAAVAVTDAETQGRNATVMERVSEAAESIEQTENPKTKNQDPKSNRRIPITDLKPGHDANGREIFIEAEDTLGKPRIYYTIDRKGVAHRHVRCPMTGIQNTTLPDLFVPK